ncbi:hypothetical protein J2X06_002115 [Lysobacter niastensis]|uniref:Secreted protein n=1 Tax=Lysobacter niastensis TaxID=380629 RepID=A0ABU1WB95_9GAMM|nr:hypothetical protein [Lysobacter niastensis]MDR7134906.1 hypothetical protein [Lysobacter niastensis]
MRRLRLVLITLSLLALAACAAAPAGGSGQSAQSQTSPPASVSAVPAKVKIDSTCRSDADCAIKNVGNCCGEFPACVNVNSPTDPAGVQAECARTGRMSVCGFRQIQGCQCVQGQCQDRGGNEGAIPVEVR